MKRAILVLGLLGLLVCSAYAQQAIKVDIPFAFVAAGKTLPAGAYELKPLQANEFEVRNLKTSAAVLVPVITRLGTGEVTAPKVTFDVVGDKHMLESVLPVAVDGYLFAATKEKHTHKVLKAG